MAIKYKLIEKEEPGIIAAALKNGMPTLLPKEKKQ